MRSTLYIQICLVLFVTISFPCSAQWAHTFGWGGAGNGKRSSPSYQQTTQCQTDSEILRIVSQLIQLEAKRLKACEEKKIKTQDMIPDYE